MNKIDARFIYQSAVTQAKDPSSSAQTKNCFVGHSGPSLLLGLRRQGFVSGFYTSITESSTTTT
jgi:hypothetical protein